MLVIHNQFEKYVIRNTYDDLLKNIQTVESLFPLLVDEIEERNTEGLLPLASSRGNLRLFDQDFNKLFNFKSEYPELSYEILSQIKSKGQYEYRIKEIQGLGKVLKTKKDKSYYLISETLTDYRPVTSLSKLIVISLLLLAGAVAAGSWYFANQSLQPLQKINRDIKEILPSDLSKRLPDTKSGNELSEIVKTFNSLLNKIESAFMSEQNYMANVSHELKNPLTSIQSQLQYTLNKSRNIDEYKQVLNSIKDDVTGLTYTIEKLLQLARINSASNQITMEWIRLDELIYEAQEQFKNKFPEYHLILNMENLPEEEEGLEIKANKFLLSICILNLLENGGKYSDNHTVTCSLDLGLSFDIKLSIHNKGNLIHESDKEKLFKPFYRGLNMPNIKGSGIGLSLVHAITDIHAIPIEIESNVNEGNKFILHFKSKKSKS